MISEEIPLLEISIPNYLTKVKLSNKRRPKYYKKLGDLPKTWNRDKYYVKNKVVYKKETGEKVLKNPRSAGTPKYEHLSGNKFWSGYGDHRIRSKLAKALKESYLPYIKGIPPIEEFPIRVEWEIHREADIPFDLSNLWFYYKMFEDALVDAKIIPDDNIQYITSLSGPRLIPIKKGETPKLVFRFYKDSREVVNKPYYKNE